MTVSSALDLIKDMAGDGSSDFTVGARTVLDAETGRSAILAGASFIVGPNTDSNLIQLCRRYSIAVISGAFTPTEILHAWELGVDIVKVLHVSGTAPALSESAAEVTKEAGRNNWTATAYADGRFYDDVTYELEVVDRVDGGDAFTGGFLYAYLTSDRVIKKSLQYGNTACALKRSISWRFELDNS